MFVRDFLPEDYSDVCKWWQAQGWPVLPGSMLSSYGFLAVKGEEKLAAAFIYPTEGGNYIMEWTVGNPEANWEDRAEGIRLTIEAGARWAKQDGAVNIFTMTKQQRFMDKLIGMKFKKTDEGMTHLVLNLKDFE